MIPENIVEFLHGSPLVSVGTRDEVLRPAHTWVSGILVDADRVRVTCFVQEEAEVRIRPHLEGNGRIALDASDPTHETYQLKGRYLDRRPADGKDRAVQDLHRSKIIAQMLRCGYPEPVARVLVLGFRHLPAVAITFRVEEIYLQTPGPNAGTRLG